MPHSHKGKTGKFTNVCIAMIMVLLMLPFASQPAQAAGTFIKGINMNGNAVTIDGNAWLSYTDAKNSGFSTTAAKTFGNSITWSPAVDSATNTMLNTVIYQSSSSFTMTQTIANGSYDVYFWLTENYADNARKVDIKLEGTTVASGVGAMNKNTWVKYGPYTVTVSDGALNVDFVRISGDPQVAGMAIFTSGGVTITPVTPTNTFTITNTPTNTFTPTPTNTQGTGKDGWTTIQAESYSSSTGTLQVCSGASGQILCYVSANASVQYNSVNLHSGTNKIDLSVANGGGNTGIQVWVGGVNLGTLTVGGTGGWSTYQTKSLTLPAQSGVKDVKLVFVNGNVNVDWLIFAATGTATPTNTPGPTNTPTKTFTPGPTGSKFRIMWSSDTPPFPVTNSDPDDIQTYVRLLQYSNELDIEGLLATAGTYSMIARKQNVLAILDKYDQVDENLRQHDPAYPTANALRAVTYQGLGNGDGINISWGCGSNWQDIIGAGRDSEASNAIIAAVDKPDPRPLWIGVAGGPREVAQAIWKVQNTRSTAEVNVFISKMRVFLIACQDASHSYLMNNVPNLFIIESRTTYQGMFCDGSAICNNNWVTANVINNHGPLGAIYPPAGCCVQGVQEGDTPAFLHLISANPSRLGNNPDNPTQNSWGGRYNRVNGTNHWVDGPGGSTISQWRTQVQNEFAIRMDWNLP